MPQSLALGYKDFLRETAFEIDEGRDTDALDSKQRELLHSIIQTGVRQVLSPLIPGRTEVHEWSWARPVGTLVFRPAIVGTLLTVPNRFGGVIILEAVEAIFDSDAVGRDLVFTATQHRFTITAYIRETVVHVIRSSRAPSEQTTQLSDYASGKVAPDGMSTRAIETVITETDADKSFQSDMEGDTIGFGAIGDGNTYMIARYISATEVAVPGDATGETGESGAFIVKRRALVDSVHPFAGTAYVRCADNTFRQDMADDSDVCQFWQMEDADGPIVDINGDPDPTALNDHAIIDVAGTDRATVSGVLGSIDVASTIVGLLYLGYRIEIDIEKSFDSSTVATTPIYITDLTPTEDIFDGNRHEGMYVVFLDHPYFAAFEIADIINTSSDPSTHNVARLKGDASRMTGNFAVAHAAGRLSSVTPPVSTGGIKTVITADSEIFDSGMVGLTILFHVSRGSYTITKYTSTTVVEVAGNAAVEEYHNQGDRFMVIGATDFASGDAFTMVNTGSNYELPSDYAAMDGPLTYEAGDSSYQIEIVGEGQIRALRAHSDTTARPKYAAIRPKTYDPKQGQVFELLVWPTPSEKKTVTYRYQILYNQIDADHPYPPGGPIFSEVYLASCLAVAEQRVLGKRGLRTQEFQEKLAAMIDHDRRAHRSEFIGPIGGIPGDPLLPASSPRVLYESVYYDGS